MSQIRVTAAQLISQADELQQLNQRFRGTTTELENLATALRGMWEGEANEAFTRAFANDKVQMDNFFNAIELYAARLREIAARYQNTEAVNTDIANARTY